MILGYFVFEVHVVARLQLLLELVFPCVSSILFIMFWNGQVIETFFVSFLDIVYF